MRTHTRARMLTQHAYNVLLVPPHSLTQAVDTMAVSSITVTTKAAIRALLQPSRKSETGLGLHGPGFTPASVLLAARPCSMCLAGP